MTPQAQRNHKAALTMLKRAAEAERANDPKEADRWRAYSATAFRATAAMVKRTEQ